MVLIQVGQASYSSSNIAATENALTGTYYYVTSKFISNWNYVIKAKNNLALHLRHTCYNDGNTRASFRFAIFFEGVKLSLQELGGRKFGQRFEDKVLREIKV